MCFVKKSCKDNIKINKVKLYIRIKSTSVNSDFLATA